MSNSQPSRHRAALINIGTELTSGQVLNTHSAWISERLVEKGFEVVLHETIPDDRAMILQAFERAASVARFIFVTGGLGPTTDDFTRNIVAQWLGHPLEFNEEALQHVIARLSQFGVPLVASQRQQCFFPKGAHVLPNSQGTAHGFVVQKNAKVMWVFPGPPKELQALWQDHMDAQLKAYQEGTSKLDLFTWKVSGKSEAEFCEITEKALLGSFFQTGYRASFPYVEIKAWVPSDMISAERDYWFSNLEKGLGKNLISKQGQDIAASFLSECLRTVSGTPQLESKILILDMATRGVLAERLGALLRKIPENKQILKLDLHTVYGESDIVKDPSNPFTFSEMEKALHQKLKTMAQAHHDYRLSFALVGFSEDQEWLWIAGGQSHEEVLPYRANRNVSAASGLMIENIEERRCRLVTEFALRAWSQWLKA